MNSQEQLQNHKDLNNQEQLYNRKDLNNQEPACSLRDLNSPEQPKFKTLHKTRNFLLPSPQDLSGQGLYKDLHPSCRTVKVCKGLNRGNRTTWINLNRTNWILEAVQIQQSPQIWGKTASNLLHFLNSQSDKAASSSRSILRLLKVFTTNLDNFDTEMTCKSNLNCQDTFDSFFSGSTFPPSFPAMETSRLTAHQLETLSNPMKLCSGRVFRATRGSLGTPPATSTWSTGHIPFSQSSSTSHFTLYQFPEINYLCIYSTALGSWIEAHSEWYFEPDIDIKQSLIELCKNALWV